ncbi:MAG: hypothetical protein EA407_14710 [Rhodobacteraceae bacterium]|nr:MAG: hypothetical protein EA407_14710 [Paracoccaceae bacterium]
MPPLIEAIIDPTAYGAVLLHITFIKAWMFLSSLPLLWLAMRAGSGGLISFALLGLGYGFLIVLIFEGISLDISAGLGLVGALVVRMMLGYERPEAFLHAPRRTSRTTPVGVCETFHGWTRFGVVLALASGPADRAPS